MTQPTGVFVRLPLSDEQKRKVVAEMMFAATSVADAFEKAILAIGTPVTGGELKTMAHISRGGDRISLRRKTERDIPLVRQSDAQAQIAALGAEVGRLQSHIASILEVALSRADGTTCIHLVKQAFSLAKTTEMTADEVVSRTVGELFPIMKGPEA
ncbi:hypothetical protein K6W37_10025 [Acetobacter senegalensis]|uniref:hypothetical protein n=1 Tax=Acetobacter senegalensis TaxID=446692 RepID=UPI001EDA2AB5|nr:hypothetical protein [Acetobacter senegalensis]MCG4254222.1 hypothetical protein [Acetobacter senegalensis]